MEKSARQIREAFGKEIARLAGHGSPVGMRIVTTSTDGTARNWQTGNRTPRRSWLPRSERETVAAVRSLLARAPGRTKRRTQGADRPGAADRLPWRQTIGKSRAIA